MSRFDPPIEMTTYEDVMHDTTTVRMTQHLASRQVAGHVVIPNELIADEPALEAILEYQMDRVFRPWRHPDPNPFPVIDLFPRVTRLSAWARRTRRRVVGRLDWSERIAP